MVIFFALLTMGSLCGSHINSLVYDGNNITLFKGKYFELSPHNWAATGGPYTSCTPSPSLPAGISIDHNCVLSGTPTNNQPFTKYTITAKNVTGYGPESTTEDIFIRITSNTATKVYGQSGSFTSNIANNGGISADSLNAPNGGCAFDNGGVYIADSLNNRVLYYPPGSSTAIRVYGQGGNFTTNIANNGGISANSLNFPTNCTLDNFGNLWISDTGNNRVLYYPAGSTVATRVYGQGGSFTTNLANNGGISANSLSGPEGIIMLPKSYSDEYIFVADTQNNRVLYYMNGSATATHVYGQGGSFTTNIANNGGITAASLNNPKGITFRNFDPYSISLYIVDSGNNRILTYYISFTSANSLLANYVYGQNNIFTTNTANNGGLSAYSLNFPTGIVIDSIGRLYISDNLNNRVITGNYVFGQANNLTTAIANNGGISADSLSGPVGVFLNNKVGLFMADTANNRVLFY